VTTWERLHFLHRAWRYRLRSEKLGISFLLSRDLSGKTVVDIGANRGIYSYWMHKKVGSKGRVIAFEPQQELFDWLHQLKIEFGLHRLEIVNAGLSSTSGSQDLFRPQNHWGGASLQPSEQKDVDTLLIKITRLDDYFHNHSDRPIGFIKCDVEGHEYEVFLGGEQVLLQDRPDLLFECYQEKDTECRTFKYLESLDYEGFCFSRQGLVPCSKYQTIRGSLHKHALSDFVFLPRERAVNMIGHTSMDIIQSPILSSAYASG